MKTNYKGYTIEVNEVKRDWSEDAYEYHVVDTNIKDECEGQENAVQYAKEDIDKI